MLHAITIGMNKCEGVPTSTNKYVGLYGQAEKCIWWMPWQLKAMKDVVACDKLRGVGKQTLIRRFPNGETHLSYERYLHLNT